MPAPRHISLGEMMDHKEKLKEELRVIEGCERWLSRLETREERLRVLAFLNGREVAADLPQADEPPTDG